MDELGKKLEEFGELSLLTAVAHDRTAIPIYKYPDPSNPRFFYVEMNLGGEWLRVKVPIEMYHDMSAEAVDGSQIPEELRPCIETGAGRAMLFAADKFRHGEIV